MHAIVQIDLEEIIGGVGIDTLRKFEGKHVLISGACGFLGSWYIALFQHLNQKYFAQPVRVWAIDSMIAADKQNSLVDVTDKNIKFQQTDISTLNILGKVDFIIHAAGIASPIYYRQYPIETIEGMAFGLHNLLNYAMIHNVESFLFFSSSEMYGNPSNDMVPTPETYNGNVSCIGPRSCYDESKRMGETMCHSYHRMHNVPVKWVRPFNVYGPGMRLKDDRVVPKFLFQLLRGEDITVHIPGVQTRTFCYITDAMVGFLKAMLVGENGEVYNIGQQQPEVTIEQLAEKMYSLFPSSGKIVKIEMPQEYPTDQAQRRCPDITKASTDLGFTPMIDLTEGLRRSYAWSRDLLNSTEPKIQITHEDL